jgi:hypothetical protein
MHGSGQPYTCYVYTLYSVHHIHHIVTDKSLCNIDVLMNMLVTIPQTTVVFSACLCTKENRGYSGRLYLGENWAYPGSLSCVPVHQRESRSRMDHLLLMSFKRKDHRGARNACRDGQNRKYTPYIWWFPCQKFLGLARTVYLHRIWSYIWWFPCQEYRVDTVYMYGTGQPQMRASFRPAS